MKNPIITHNLLMIQELLPECQKQVIDFMNESFRLGKCFKIAEVYRSEDDHMHKFLSGRTVKEVSLLPPELQEKLYSIMEKNPTLQYGEILTNTPISNHRDRRSFDIKPLECSYNDIHDIAVPFGIDWTIENERWHFEVVDMPEIEKPKKKGSFFDFLHI